VDLIVLDDALNKLAEVIRDRAESSSCDFSAGPPHREMKKEAHT
jgi:hypothetical protein